MKKKQILLYNHAGSGNKGCEALVRGTTKIIFNKLDNASIDVASYEPQEDIEANIDNVFKFFKPNKSISRYSFDWVIDVFYRRILKNKYLSEKRIYKNLEKETKTKDICLSIGGDTYCYGDNEGIYLRNSIMKESKKKLVFWGCSVNPEIIDKNMVTDLNSYDLIIARESITYKAFLDHGVKNVYLHTDSAFVMQSQQVDLPMMWNDNIIGINLSPLVMKYGNKEAVMNAVKALIFYIIENTEYSVVLIPHVYWTYNNDLAVLNEIYQSFSDQKKVGIVKNKYNAPQLKYIISKCNLFIGARTHSTIAAYSSCVPALAIGYSVKALGIARDLFGDENGLVIPVQEIKNNEALIEAFINFELRKQELNAILEDRMPEYIANAFTAGDRIKQLID